MDYNGLHAAAEPFGELDSEGWTAQAGLANLLMCPDEQAGSCPQPSCSCGVPGKQGSSTTPSCSRK